MIAIGIDPGKGGGIATLRDSEAHAIPMPATERDLYAQLMAARKAAEYAGVPIFAVIEQVGATPQMGVTSAFSFGEAVGLARMALVASEIPFEEVSPLRWQRAMGALLPKGKPIKEMTQAERAARQAQKKRLLKEHAQRLFPRARVTLATCDALLLAEYARRKFSEFGGAGAQSERGTA